MFSISKFKLLSLSTLILLITAFFWLLPELFPFENARGDSSSFITDSLDRFGQRERTQIGEHENIYLVIRYLDPQGHKRLVKKPNASFIKVHFYSIDLLPGDFVTVTDPIHQQEYTYPGVSDFTTDTGPGFWALTVFGDSVEIELKTRYSDKELRNLDIRSYGLSIDKFARGYSMNKIQDFSYLPESVCGSDERLDAACYQDSHLEEFSKSHAVAMHVFNGLGWCSSWRVGPGNHMFTNEHCITNQAELNASEFWFGHQRLDCGSGPTQIPTIVTGNTLLEDDYLKDFALFTVNDSNQISEFGWLEIDDRAPLQDEEIYIPQQPGGLSPNDQRKVIAFSSDMNSEKVCRINKPIADGRWLNTDTGYMCDTSPGASGSPVLARSSNAVLSLHHLGGCRNQGVRMNQIWPMVSEHLMPAPDLITVSIPEKVEVGSAFPVLIEAQNNNAPSPEGIINVSIRYSEDSRDLLISEMSASWADRLQLLEPWQGRLFDKNCQEIAGGAQDHFIEAVDTNWEAGERHQLTFNVTPHRQGTLWLRVRNTMKDVRAGCNYYNETELSSGLGTPDSDQQGWEVVRFPIKVTPKTQAGPLVVAGLIIDDDRKGALKGKGDSVIDCGEVFEMGVELINQGSTTVKEINGTLASMDENLTVISDLGVYADIAPGISASSTAVLKLSEHTPHGHKLQLDLEVSAANGGPWIYLLELTAACKVKDAGKDDQPTVYLPFIFFRGN